MFAGGGGSCEAVGSLWTGNQAFSLSHSQEVGTGRVKSIVGGVGCPVLGFRARKTPKVAEPLEVLEASSSLCG